ncbi:hypothetical protein BOKEGFJH_00759 [Chlamydia avium]|uniref:Uncharacterized protein n=1 Tax=Chlamydia avium TaxID=1457141 RepID=A0ABN0MT94_9CHLA|nr:hypothetical protein [Chlamydia avium]EPP36215.1 hypothetical protein CP10743SC13_0124 [Chlamydia psittaci 10_743_SC13]EPP38796.1 hypothetical protein CP10881SC42_0212 [Chlamydia avium]VVT43223.1 hypothetical protein BOKEGFJH_00759 [Chlamydia avium]
MSFVKKYFHYILKYYYYFFPLAAFLIPLIFFSCLSDFQKNYQYFVFSLISSGGWFFAIICREKQLKFAANQLLQTKIRKIIEKDEGLRKVCASVEEGRQESMQLRSRNQELSKQLLLARNAFMKTKAEFQQLESLISQLKEENQCLHLQLDALSQEYKEKEEESQKLHRELTDALAYQQVLNEEYQATFEEQHNMLDVRQAYIGKLESKVQDLMCEIRNLLQLDSTAAEHFPKKSLLPSKDVPNQLLSELKKIAFKVENTEAASSLTASRYIRSESSVRNYSLECRQLFDSLREENFGMLFVYAPQTRRAVFANSLFKVWTGHGVEDFFAMDEDIVVSGLPQWEADLRIQDRKERSGKLVIKTKSRGHTPFYYCLTVLNKGPLHNHVLGVLHPVHRDIVQG